jgi:hypothetical protein
MTPPTITELQRMLEPFSEDTLIDDSGDPVRAAPMASGRAGPVYCVSRPMIACRKRARFLRLSRVIRRVAPEP